MALHFTLMHLTCRIWNITNNNLGGSRMRKHLLAILVVSLICCAQIPVHAELNVYELQRRIIFWENECYILTDEGTVFANAAGYQAHPGIKAWKNIIALKVVRGIAAGLTTEGTVLVSVVGTEDKGIIEEIKTWENIKQIAVSYRSVYGLTSDNRIVYAGYLFPEQKERLANSDGWGQIAFITAYTDLFALTKEGKVHSTLAKDFSELDHVIDVISSGMETLFLKDNGTCMMYVNFDDNLSSLSQVKVDQIVQITYFDHNETAILKNGHEVIVPKYSSLESFLAPDIVAISGYAWIDNKGHIHMDKKRFGLEGIDLPVFQINRVLKKD